MLRLSAAALALLLVTPSLPQPAPETSRTGAVRVSGRALADDGGEFPALGASLFWAAWAYRNDRPRLDEHLTLLKAHRFDYIRALGIVGRQPYWKGREIDWRWPDYDEVIAGLTDHVYDTYGLRTQWTIFADGDEMIPAREDRFALVDRFLSMAGGREHKIMHFEVANESWQNGFGGTDGIAQIREIARYLEDRTDIPVAISDSEGTDCADHHVLYKSVPVQMQTEHFDRDVSGPLRQWAPVLQPWRILECPGLPPVVSNNEPIGPESSVEQDSDPMRIVAGAVVSYLSGVGLYVLHTDAGVRGLDPITAMPDTPAILAGLRQMKGYLPADLPNWSRHRHDSAGHPFVTYAGTTRGAVRTGRTDDGPAEVFAAVKGDRFFAAAVGIINEITLEARRPMNLEVLHPLTGETIERADLAAGDQLEPRPLTFLVLSGTFSDAAP
jgi:hypothetical protein